jgi:hypothetical protein
VRQTFSFLKREPTNGSVRQTNLSLLFPPELPAELPA